MKELLDNIIWHALSGPQAGFAAGTDRARRYARGFPPIVGFADAARPDFGALRPFCEAGEQLYIGGWSDAAPAGWRVESQASMFTMLWEAAMPAADTAPEAAPLGPAQAERAVELAALTKPGPFGPRTIELGQYFGVFEGERLLAMAGERMHAGQLREISGVCTHPDAQGQGHARRLMHKLIRRQMQRGETPFLHVMRHNANAVRLYERMGFSIVNESIVRVISPV